MTKPLVNNPSPHTAYMREWRKKNAEKNKEYQRAYWKVYSQDGSVREIAKKRAKDFYWKDTERANQVGREYRAKNKDAVRARGKRWIEKNIEKHRMYQRLYHNARRLKKLGLSDGEIDWELIEKRADGKCGICDLELTDPIEFDHIIPIVRGGRHATDNLQIAHRFCNRSKGAKLNFKIKAANNA